VPETEVVFYADDDGSAPVLEWMDALPEKAQNKCIVWIERLAAYGYELRRPDADTLEHGIHELRVRHGRVNYRILYFFCGRRAVLAHGIVKEKQIPKAELKRALARKGKYERNSGKHTYRARE
jgi:phage-related protein